MIDWAPSGSIQRSTSCPEAVWKPLFFRTATIQKRNGSVVILDIGCNDWRSKLIVFDGEQH